MTKQMRTYLDGSTWLRWVEPVDHQPPATAGRAPRLPAGWNCASCRPVNVSWTDAPTETKLPRVDLVYDCHACGQITYQGRLAAR